jgi:hypothetical protein
MRTRPFIIITILAAIVSAAAGATAAAPDPVFWTFDRPQGRAGEHGHIIEMVVVPTLRPTQGYAPVNPLEAADSAVKRIRNRGLRSSEICILMLWLGMGDGVPGNKLQRGTALFRHWCDGLPRPPWNQACVQGEPVPIDSWWATPWMSSGVRQTRQYVADFIAEYQYNQDRRNTGDPVPDPARFHFDTERRIFAISGESMRAFEHLVHDARWESEELFGYEGAVTMADLWRVAEENGVRMPDLTEGKNWAHHANHDWVNWYECICLTVADGAMKAACYDPIHRAWPTARCSNYGTSLRIKPPYVHRAELGWSAAGWWNVRWQGAGDLQAVVLYPPESAHQRRGETFWQATMRLHRQNVDVLIKSLDDGRDPGEITPWLYNIGEVKNTKRLGPDRWATHRVSKADMRQMLAMLRGRRIREFIIWNDKGPTERDWDDLADVIDQVWLYDPVEHAVVLGTMESPQPVDRLKYALDGPLSVTAEERGARHMAAIDVNFELRPPGRVPLLEMLNIIVEADLSTSSAAETAELTISLLSRRDRKYEPVYTGTLSAGDPSIHEAAVTSGGTYVRPETGSVQVRLACTADAAFTAQIDLVQVIEADD